MMTLFVAMHKHALTAAAVGMWDYPAALAHIEVCQQVAARARFDTKKRFQHLALHYDAIARKDWAERAALGVLSALCRLPWPGPGVPSVMSGEQSFSVDTACLREDASILQRAKVAYDVQAEKEQEKPKGKGKGKDGKGDGKGKGKDKGSHALHLALTILL